jgi:hypothetical protein
MWHWTRFFFCSLLSLTLYFLVLSFSLQFSYCIHQSNVIFYYFLAGLQDDDHSSSLFEVEFYFSLTFYNLFDFCCRFFFIFFVGTCETSNKTRLVHCPSLPITIIINSCRSSSFYIRVHKHRLTTYINTWHHLSDYHSRTDHVNTIANWFHWRHAPVL